MKCKYCHKPVGLFSSKHKECELKHFALLSEIKEILLYKFESSELLDYLKLKQELSEIIANGYVTDKDFDGIVFEIMNMIFSGNCKINNFLFPVFFISMPVELKNKIDNLPLLLGKKENVLWVFKNVEGYEEKTGHKYIGGSNGVSMRICKGVYYHVGASKGHSVAYQYQTPLGRGIFVVTNKYLYFLGVKQVKLSISKILSFEPYSDGIVLVKDGTNPKPYTFIGFDSWFVVNAMQLLVE